MASGSTIYDVKVQYALDDKASGGLKSIGNAAERASQSTNALGDGLKQLAMLAAGAFGIHKAKEAFVDFNQEMESLKINMAAAIGMNLGNSFEDASIQASALVEEFKKFSVNSQLTTKEVSQFSTSIAAGAFGAGASMDQFVTLSERGAVAAKTLGIESHLAGIQMQEMLMGNVRRTERFTMLLLHSKTARETMKGMGLHGDALAAFRSATEAQRVSIITAAVKDPALVAAGNAHLKSFEGMMSTLKDRVQLTLGAVGESLFNSLKKEMSALNTWFETHGPEIQNFGKAFSGYLVEGFQTVKNIAGFIVEHKDLLLTLAKGWLLSKGIGMAVGSIGSIFSAGGGFAGALQGEAAGLAGGFGKVSSVLAGAGGVIMALGAFATALQTAAEWLDAHHKAEIGKEGEMAGVRAAASAYEKRGGFGGYNESSPWARQNQLDMIKFGGHNLSSAESMSFILKAKEFHGFTKDAEVDLGIMENAFKNLGDASDSEAKRLALLTKVAFANMDPDKLKHILGLNNADPLKTGKQGGVAGKGDTHIGSIKIEVASDDPDRFVIALNKKLEQISKSRTQAKGTLRGGL